MKIHDPDTGKTLRVVYLTIKPSEAAGLAEQLRSLEDSAAVLDDGVTTLLMELRGEVNQSDEPFPQPIH